ncbi:Transglutaminase-like superfamily protein [Alkalispirochaeta americana]|uniref:Transglutaminase-like superfamily protein n=1 Tax=Alkalispirochaeta americana TaxID=159291 RepID=A0A1N6N7R3_9SPIO|nr:transglutaminase domain-containing protein [Alkalispirochaeta americana]SIP88082.1 Transglutaminase-like superfamily protein [Alkalispirochaeta americana]
MALLWNARRPPLLEELRPNQVREGDRVTLTGRYLGDEGRLEVDGVALDRTALTEWSPSRIVFTMPPDFPSGMVRVRTDGGLSNALFLTSQHDIPQLVRQNRLRVALLTPPQAGRGDLVTIQGDGFGPRTAQARLEFRPPSEKGMQPGEPVSFGGDQWWIVSWSDRVIRFAVPQELPPGELELFINGQPGEVSLEVTAPGALLEEGLPREYLLRQRVDFPAPPDATVVLLPRIPRTSGQIPGGAVSLLGDDEGGHSPGAWAYRPVPRPVRQDEDKAESRDEEHPRDQGKSEDQPEKPRPEVVERIDRVERRSQRWEITANPGRALLEDDGFRRAFRLFLADQEDLPVSAAAIQQIRSRVINLRNPPLPNARRIHQEVLRRLTPDPEGTHSWEEALEGEGAAPGAYADLTAALLRAAGIPARRLWGVLLKDSGETVDHAWVEAFIPRVGWIPLDTALGSGMYSNDSRESEFSRVLSFYKEPLESDTFGALDDRRIALRVEGVSDPRRFPQGALVEGPHGFSGGTLRLEAAPGRVIDADTPLWHRPDLQN